MSSVDRLLDVLGESRTEPLSVERPADWLRSRDEPPLDVEGAGMSMHFPVAPTAASLATGLLELDREARRVAAAIRRGVSPAELFGRGRRLEPVRRGLVVEAARPGSLDVILGLGALYTVVTSQPLSFALNVASLLGYGRVVTRAAKAGGEAFVRELRVGRTDWTPTHADDGPQTVIPTPYGDAILPSDPFDSVTLSVRTADGDVIEFEARRES